MRICYFMLDTSERILFLLPLVVDCIPPNHVLDRFNNLPIIWDELPEEFDLPLEGLHSFLVDWVRNLHDSLNSVRINLDPTLGDDMPKEISLRHCKYALLGIQGYPVLSTSLKDLLKITQVVWPLSGKNCHVRPPCFVRWTQGRRFP